MFVLTGLVAANKTHLPRLLRPLRNHHRLAQSSLLTQEEVTDLLVLTPAPCQ